MMSDVPQPAARLLVVCTGNICRSPAVERLLAAGLAGADVAVGSAGTRAVVGHAMSAPMVPLVEAAGARADGFAARQLTAELVREQDLVLTATRAHRSAVAELVPSAVRRTFTVRELARLLTATGPLPGETVAERLRAVPTAVTAVRAASAAVDDDIVDPIGRSDAVYRESFEQIAPAVAVIVAALRGPAAA